MTTLTGFRLVQILRRDTLQAIAARTLADATRWAELVWINKLTYPYITDDPAIASDTVLLSGGLIRVPAVAVQSATTTDPDKLFGIDFYLDGEGDLEADESGDIAVVAGLANLNQALEDRLETDLGELIFHLDYGCRVRELLGKGNGPTNAILGAEYVSASLSADPRVQAVTSSEASVTGASTTCSAVVNPIVGLPVTVTSGA